MYKLVITPPSTEVNTIIDLDKNSSFPNSAENCDYQQFIRDVAEQGMEIVEGPDIIEPSYVELRVAEYPSREDQLDMMYWDEVNETTVWRDTIQAIKERHPKTITGGTTIGEIPTWVQEAVDALSATPEPEPEAESEENE